METYRILQHCFSNPIFQLEQGNIDSRRRGLSFDQFEVLFDQIENPVDE